MQDIKNFYLAWVAMVPNLAMFESPTTIAVMSAIVLPIIFFTIGKAVDVLLQFYFHNREKK